MSCSIPIAEWQGQGTSIAMTESLVESNYRFEALGLQAAVDLNKGYPPTRIVSGWGTPEQVNDSFTGSYFYPQQDGDYNLNASICIDNNSGYTSSVTTLYIFKNGGIYKSKTYPTMTAYKPVFTIETLLKDCKKGDYFDVRLEINADGEKTDTASNNTYLQITRIPDYTAGTLPSFGIATPSEYGLVKAEISRIKLNKLIVTLVMKNLVLILSLTI